MIYTIGLECLLQSSWCLRCPSVLVRVPHLMARSWDYNDPITTSTQHSMLMTGLTYILTAWISHRMMLLPWLPSVMSWSLCSIRLTVLRLSTVWLRIPRTH